MVQGNLNSIIPCEIGIDVDGVKEIWREPTELRVGTYAVKDASLIVEDL